MLTHLQIKDFAIIDAAELELTAGLTALTGETGAGKSILVDAVLLAIGGRGGADVIRAGCERTDIVATFTLKDNPSAVAWLAAHDVEHEHEVQLRRVISQDGRSRAYLNGQTQPITQVRALGELLLDIHGQQEFLTLTRANTQRALLDAHGRHDPVLAPVARLALEYRALSAELSALKTAALDRDQRIELLAHQVKELTALALKPGEAQDLQLEAQRLGNHGRLALAAQNALQWLYEEEGQDAYAKTGRALNTLKAAAEFDPKLEPMSQLLADALIPMKEASQELAAYLEALDMDPKRQEIVQSRIATIEQLARKHRVTAAQLPEQLVSLTGELQRLTDAESTLAELELRQQAALKAYQPYAQALSQARQKAAHALGNTVTQLMKGLGMPGGQFTVAVQADASVVDAHGIDTIEFLVSANPGQPPKPIAKVASGGELSRISLAVQVAAAHQTGGSTCMIFDEVDAGVGGAVAEMVGRELHALGERGQVLCVTHLAQVAGQADQHIKVAKQTDGKQTRTALTPLTDDARVEELARMLAGVEITSAARDHAREMLSKPAASSAQPKKPASTVATKKKRSAP
jgi:DNA repair protein RecN (Recombination protein N)